MNLPAHVRVMRHHLYEGGRKILGVRGREADAFDSGDIGHVRQELGKRHVFALIGIDVLPKKRDLFVPLSRKGVRFFENPLRGTGPFPPTGIGHHAETAKIITAPHDGNPGVDPGPALRKNRFISFVFRQIHGHRPFSAFQGLRQEVRQLSIGIRPREHVDDGVRFHQFLFEILGHTPQDADHQVP